MVREYENGSLSVIQMLGLAELHVFTKMFLKQCYKNSVVALSFESWSDITLHVKLASLVWTS